MRALAENPNPTVADIIPIVGASNDYISRLVELDKQKVRSSERAREIVEETRKLELEAGYLPEDMTPLPEQLTRSILRSSELPEGSFDVQPWDRHPTDPLYQPPPPRGVAPNTGIAPQSFPPQQQWAPPMLEEFRRLDGTVKGDGYLGQVATNGGYMTELSAGLPGTEEGFYPLLGPWLDENEVATLQRGGSATPEMYRKARMAAEERKLVGQPVFAPPGYSSGPVLEQPANQGAKSDGKNGTGKKGRSR
jgi:hypothetical protein